MDKSTDRNYTAREIAEQLNHASAALSFASDFVVSWSESREKRDFLAKLCNMQDDLDKLRESILVSKVAK